MVERISIIGCGKLGLAFALVCEEAGIDVLGCDLNSDYVKLLNDKTFNPVERDINRLLTQSKRFKATTDIEVAVAHSDLLFCFVATPSLPDGRYDHSHIEDIITQLTQLHSDGVDLSGKTFIIGCTVMPKYTDTVYERLSKFGMQVCYNPEFIAQGDIVRGLKEPDMILLGTSSHESRIKIEQVYNRFLIHDVFINEMSNTAAEITKISLNCFLTTKISFANMIGEIAINSGVQNEVKNILHAIGQDSRIGNKYLKLGFGYGGPCLTRDNKSLYVHAATVGINATISKATDDFNNAHAQFLKYYLIDKNTEKLPFIFDTLCYKKGTNLIVDSQQYRLCIDLLEAGYSVVVPEYDKAMLYIYQQMKDTYPDNFVYSVDENDKVKTEGIKIQF